MPFETEEIPASMDMPLAFQILPLVEWWQLALEKNAKALQLDLQSRSLGILAVYIIMGERRPIRLAEHMGISRQAVHQMIQFLEKGGRLNIVPDPADGRATIVVPTEEFLRSGVRTIAILHAIEKRMEKKFGTRKFSMFKAMVGADWGEVPMISEQEERDAAHGSDQG